MDENTQIFETLNAIQNASKAMNPPVELTREQAKEFLYNLELERIRIFPMTKSLF